MSEKINNKIEKRNNKKAMTETSGKLINFCGINKPQLPTGEKTKLSEKITDIETEFIGVNEMIKEPIEDNQEKRFVIPDLSSEDILVVVRTKKDGEESIYIQRNNDKYGGKSITKLDAQMMALSQDDVESSQTMIYLPENYDKSEALNITGNSLKSMAGLLTGSENVNVSTFRPSSNSEKENRRSSVVLECTKDGRLNANYSEQTTLNHEA